jgi:hypothetical protein
METLRFPIIALFVFAATFFVAYQITAPRPLEPDPRVPTFQQRAAEEERHRMEATSSASDNDAVRDRLRQAVLDGAKSLGDDPCNEAMRRLYVEAATQYARAWLSIVPCLRTSTCGSSDGRRLDRAREAFGSPLDHRVRDAMQRVHSIGALARSDFPADVVGFVAQLAADPLMNPRADPTIRAATLEMRESIAAAEGRPPANCGNR